jgi:hypothetical protein
MFHRSAAADTTLVLSPTIPPSNTHNTHASPSPEAALSAYATLHSPFASYHPGPDPAHRHHHPHPITDPDSANDSDPHMQSLTPEEASIPQERKQSQKQQQDQERQHSHQYQHPHPHHHHEYEDQHRVSRESWRSESKRSPQVQFPSEAPTRRDSPSFSALDSPRNGNRFVVISRSLSSTTKTVNI